MSDNDKSLTEQTSQQETSQFVELTSQGDNVSIPQELNSRLSSFLDNKDLVIKSDKFFDIALHHAQSQSSPEAYFDAAQQQEAFIEEFQK